MFLAAATVRSAYWAAVSDLPEAMTFESDLLNQVTTAESQIADLLAMRLSAVREKRSLL
jgi:hypothetical protein